MRPDFSPRPGESMEIGAVSNVSGKEFEYDVESMLRNALSEALQAERLVWLGPDQPNHLILTARIVDYEPGNAFQRWLLPGWGSTVLSVDAELRDANTGSLAGSLSDRHSIAFGGGYTIGAWKAIFDAVAKDIASDLAKAIRGS
jgi:hypothetical protein